MQGVDCKSLVRDAAFRGGMDVLDVFVEIVRHGWDSRRLLSDPPGGIVESAPSPAVASPMAPPPPALWKETKSNPRIRHVQVGVASYTISGSLAATSRLRTIEVVMPGSRTPSEIGP
jgi:hypothetical protein